MIENKTKYKNPIFNKYRIIGLAFIFLFFVILKTNAQVCSGNLGIPVFTETFGTGIRADLNTTTSGTTTYCYEDGTGSDCVADTNSYMTCNEATLYSGDAQDLNQFWVTGGDHTGDLNGMMAVFNADFEANEFYRNTINNLCGGTVFEFAAWIANLYDPMNGHGPCQENNGDALYPDVTFEIRNSVTDVLIASISTGNVLPTVNQDQPNNIQWDQFGLTFIMPIGLSSIDIVMRNNGDGGCGNDLAIDDITIRPCGPTAIIESEAVICSYDQINLQALIGSGFTDPYILWQIWNSDLNAWENIGTAGPVSQNFDEIVLTNVALDDSIRFIAAGDASSIANTNCPITSSIFIIPPLTEIISTIYDTIQISINNQATYNLCIQDELDLMGNIEDIYIIEEPQNIDFSYSQIGESVCFDFLNNAGQNGEDSLLVIVCDDFACKVCDTTIIKIQFQIPQDTSGCFIPNVLTPNGDGLNDFYIIDCLDAREGVELQVYNRWGNEVYRSNNYQNDWNGYYKSKPLPDGTYYYVIKFKNGLNEIVNLAGDLTILK